jgi:hypothetical protein
VLVRYCDDFVVLCPTRERAELARELAGAVLAGLGLQREWRQQLLAYFSTRRANNGGTEAINGIIELHRRIAPRLPQPGQLPAPHDPGRRTPGPPESPMSRICDTS